jgi:hypothetical protein
LGKQLFGRPTNSGCFIAVLAGVQASNAEVSLPVSCHSRGNDVPILNPPLKVTNPASLGSSFLAGFPCSDHLRSGHLLPVPFAKVLSRTFRVTGDCQILFHVLAVLVRIVRCTTVDVVSLVAGNAPFFVFTAVLPVSSLCATDVAKGGV